MRILALLTVLSLALGCEDEPKTEGMAAAQPAPGMPAGHPPAGMPAGHPTTGAPAMGALPDLPSGNISGTLRASPEMAKLVTAGDVAFVMARNAATGSLLAVSRVQIDTLPVRFELAGGTAMHGGATLAGKVRVEARVDKDGDAMTKNPGDLIGEVDGLVAVPANDVVLTLTKTL